MPRDLFGGRPGPMPDRKPDHKPDRKPDRRPDRRPDRKPARRRILYCWLPCFATDRVARRRPALALQPVAIVRHERGRRLAVAVNGPARRNGVRTGQSLADARSLYPALTAVDADPTADSRLLLDLARWCTRYTPWVAPEASAEDDSSAPLSVPRSVEAEAALLLDIGGCAHLAGGEAALVEDLVSRLQAFGFTARCAVADTPGAARAWARYGDPLRPVIPEGAQAGWLKPLPAAALRLREADAETLQRLGIATVGNLMALPRAAVANRFQGGSITSVLYRLDRALGAVPESIAPLPAPADYSVRQHYAEPIGTPEGMTAAFERLLLALTRKLEAAGMGARQLEFGIIRADDTLDSVRIGVSRPARDPAHLARLFAPRLEGLDPDPGIETVMLSAVSVEPFTIEQQVFQKVRGQSAIKQLPENRQNRPALQGRTDSSAVDALIDRLIDRLANRLGRTAVLRALPCETALPESQTRYAPASTSAPTIRRSTGPLGRPRSAWPARPCRCACSKRPNGLSCRLRRRMGRRPVPRRAVSSGATGPGGPSRAKARPAALAAGGTAKPLSATTGRWRRFPPALRTTFRTTFRTGPRRSASGCAATRRQAPAHRWSVHGLMG